jgi:hypothetical protein
MQEVSASDAWPVRAAARAVASAPAAGFHYPDPACWRSQMLDRPHAVQALRIGATCRALIETVDDTDRLQWLDGDAGERSGAIRAVAARAAGRGRRFFMYSTCPEEVAAAARLGLATRAGYLMALPLKTARAAIARDWPGMLWRVQSGDRL